MELLNQKNLPQNVAPQSLSPKGSSFTNSKKKILDMNIDIMHPTFYKHSDLLPSNLHPYSTNLRSQNVLSPNYSTIKAGLDEAEIRKSALFKEIFDDPRLSQGSILMEAGKTLSRVLSQEAEYGVRNLSPGPGSYVNPIGINGNGFQFPSQCRSSCAPRFGPSRNSRFHDSEVTSGTFMASPGPGSYMPNSDFDVIERKVVKIDKVGRKHYNVIKVPKHSKAPRYPALKRKKCIDFESIFAPGPGSYNVPSDFPKMKELPTITKASNVGPQAGDDNVFVEEYKIENNEAAAALMDDVKSLPEVGHDNTTLNELAVQCAPIIEKIENAAAPADLNQTDKNQQDTIKELIDGNKTSVIEIPQSPLNVKEFTTEQPNPNTTLITDPNKEKEVAEKPTSKTLAETPEAEKPSPPPEIITFLAVLLAISLLVRLCFLRNRTTQNRPEQ